MESLKQNTLQVYVIIYSWVGCMNERLTDYLQQLLLLITFYVRTSLERQSLVTSSWSSCSKSCDGGQTSLY